MVPPLLWTVQSTLEGRFIRLEPLTLDHAQGWLLFYDPSTFEFQGRGGPEEPTLEATRKYLQKTLEEPNRLNWSIFHLDTRKCVLYTAPSRLAPAYLNCFGERQSTQRPNC